jgi:dienelactone hydrolase
VLSHGFGTWEEQQERWIPLAKFYASEGYISIYPETRQGLWDLGVTDLLSIVHIAKSMSSWNVSLVGMVGGSFGNRDAMTLIQKYPTEVYSYVALYGSFDETWPHFHYRRSNIEAIKASIFQQIGEEDHLLYHNQIFWQAVHMWNQPIVHLGQTYLHSKHGFFFNTKDPYSALAWKQQLEYFNWQLRGDEKPKWWEEPTAQ